MQITNTARVCLGAVLGLTFAIAPGVVACGSDPTDDSATAGAGGAGGTDGSAPTCDDGIVNQDESDTDCGGSCDQKCADGDGCGVSDDCQSDLCVQGVCTAATCTNMVRNGTETAADCGGLCPPCANGLACEAGSDCQSGACVQGTCAVPTCSDGSKNGPETDIDCGGSCLAKCGDHLNCSTASDCASGVCTGGACQPAACNDGVMNGPETDVDCGGGCPGCAIGESCLTADDCMSTACVGSTCACVPQPGSPTPTPTVDEDCDGQMDNTTSDLKWVVIDPTPKSIIDNGCPFNAVGTVGETCSPAGCATGACWVDGAGIVWMLCAGPGFGPGSFPGGSATCQETTLYH